MTEYKAKYNEIVSKLLAVKRKETALMTVTALLSSLSVGILLLLAASFIELAAEGDTSFRTVLALAITGLTSAAFVYFLFPIHKKNKMYSKEHPEEQVALRVGEKFEVLKDKLCNSLQIISKAETEQRTSRQLAFAAFADASATASGLKFEEIIDKSSFKKSVYFFLASSALSLILFISFSSSLGAALNRIVNFNTSFVPPPPFTLKIEPQEMTILKGDALKITVTGEGKAPKELILYIREEQQDNQDFYKIKKDSGNTYNYDIASVKRSLEFYAEAEWLSEKVKTKIGKVTVVERPLVKSMNGRLSYPAYTKLAAKEFNEQTGDLSALKGSSIRLDIQSNKPLQRAYILFEKQRQLDLATIDSASIDEMPMTDTTVIEMKAAEYRATGSFSVRNSGTYSIHIKDIDGQTNYDPIKYSVMALDDDYPVISMIMPTFDVQLSEDGLLPTEVSIGDDYGFSKLTLNYRLAESRYTEPEENYKSKEIPFLMNSTSAVVPYLWDLTEIDISPEDRYEYYFEVFDNDRVSGPKSAKTSVLSARLPSLEEVFKTAEQEHSEVEKKMDKVLKDTKEIQKQMQELNRELLKNPEAKKLDWKEKKKAEEILQKHQEIQKKIADIKEDINEMTQKLEQNNALSPETMQKYMELQQLLNEVDSPELRQMQHKMQQALQQMDPEQLQKAMNEIKFDEEQFRKNIERTTKILKRLKAEQQADALSKRADELAKRQEELDKQTENSNPDDASKREDIAKKQDELKKDLQNLQKDLSSLENLMREIGEDMPMDALEKSKEALDINETYNEMQQAAKQAKQGDFKKSSKSQKNAQKNLKQFSQEMKSLKQQMEDNVSKEIMRKMQKAINDMLELSEKQENLKTKTKSTEYNSTRFPELSQEQAELYESLANVANNMVDMSEKSFAVTPEMGKQIGKALNEMQQTFDQLTDRRTQQAAQNQGEAMSAMNSAVMNMQAKLSQMQQDGSGSCPNPGGSGQGQGQGNTPGNFPGGFMQQLQQASTSQQGINQAMQQMGQGGKLSLEEQAQMGRLVSEQSKAQKSMERMIEEQKKFSSGNDDQDLKKLQQIAKEMQEVVNEMQAQNITAETLNKQERILTRLLDAQRSVNERDFDKARESKTGRNFNRNSPGAIDFNTQEGRSKAYEDMLKSIQQGYTKDYEQLIQKYFKAVEKENLNEDKQ